MKYPLTLFWLALLCVAFPALSFRTSTTTRTVNHGHTLLPLRKTYSLSRFNFNNLWTSPSSHLTCQGSGSDEGLYKEHSWMSALSIDADPFAAVDEVIQAIAAHPTSTEERIVSSDFVLVFFISTVYEMSAAFNYEYIFEQLQAKLPHVKHIIGSTTGTAIGETHPHREVVEAESRPGISVMLGSFPKDSVAIETFSMTREEMQTADNNNNNNNIISRGSVNMVLASENVKEDIARLLSRSSSGDIFGSFASSVTSLQAPKIFTTPTSTSETGSNMIKLAAGLVGLRLSGDVAVETVIARSCFPVGPMYKIMETNGTELLTLQRIPEAEGSSGPVVAEPELVSSPLVHLGNVLEELGEQESFKLKQELLVGMVSRSPEFLLSQGHHSILGSNDYFAQKPIDLNPVTGSISLPYLPAVGSTFQFCIKDPTLARRDLKRALKQSTQSVKSMHSLQATPLAMFHLGSSQRGSKLFRFPSWESLLLAEAITTFNKDTGTVTGIGGDHVPITGFLSDCIFTKLNSEYSNSNSNSHSREPVIAEADSLFALITQPSSRSVTATLQTPATELDRSIPEVEDIMTAAEMSLFNDDKDLLLVTKRDTDAAAAVRVATMDFIIPEKTPQPSNVLESLVWEREREVDRFRERFQLSRALMQVKKAELKNPKRDLLAALKSSSKSQELPAVVVELARGSLYNDGNHLRMRHQHQSMASMAEECVAVGIAQAVSVNVDTAAHMGSYDYLEAVQQVTDSSTPVICMDFVVYAYQIFQAKASGADAVKLMASVLALQDLAYLVKICKTVGIVPIVVLSSKQQAIQVLQAKLPGITAISISSRNMRLWKIQPKKAVAILEDVEVQELIEQQRQLVGPENFLLMQEGFVGGREELMAAKRLHHVDAVFLGEELMRSDLVNSATATIGDAFKRFMDL